MKSSRIPGIEHPISTKNNISARPTAINKSVVSNENTKKRTAKIIGSLVGLAIVGTAAVLMIKHPKKIKMQEIIQEVEQKPQDAALKKWNELREVFLEATDELNALENEKKYHKLLLNITPEMQRVKGVERELQNGKINIDMFKKKLNLYTGDNLDNIVYHEGFELQEGKLVDVAIKRSKLHNKAVIGNGNGGIIDVRTYQPTSITQKDVERLTEKANSIQERIKLFTIRKDSREVCEDIAEPISKLKQMCKSDAITIDEKAALEQIDEITKAYGRQGFEFKFYEDLTPDLLPYAPFRTDLNRAIPAVYKNGKPFLNDLGGQGSRIDSSLK